MEETQTINGIAYNFYDIASADDLPPGERLYLDLDGQAVMVLNVGGEYYAIGDVCSHDNGPLGEGELDGCQVICPRHGAHFDVHTGKAVKLPAVKPIPWYPVKLDGGRLYIGVSG